MSKKESKSKATEEVEEEDGYEVERIADCISFLDAFERYFKYHELQYESIFKDQYDFTTKKQHTVCKYYYLVKWLAYTREELTWEPEENIPAVDLSTFKKLNKLPSGMMCIKVTCSAKEDQLVYEPPVVHSEFVSNKQRTAIVNLNSVTFPLNDEKYNGEFGMVPMNEYKYKTMQRDPYLKRGDELHSVKIVTLENPSKRRSSEVIEEFQKKDRSWVQIMIRHRNVVALRDSFYRSSEDGKSIEIVSIYDFSSQSLRDKIHQEGRVEWKRVCKDILRAFSLIHSYGIHQAVSLDSIQLHPSGEFKLSNFKNFTFSNHVFEKHVKSESVELAPRKFGIQKRFDATLDLYALAIVLLQCQDRRLLFRVAPTSVVEIEEDIQKAMDFPKSKSEIHFFRMLLRSRLHIHNGLGRVRYTAKSLLQDPVLSDQKWKSVECFYMHQMIGVPLKQFLYYTLNDTVEEVVHRLLKLHHDSKKDLANYLMVVSQNLTADRNSTMLVDDGETFADVVTMDVTKNGGQLLVFPILQLQPGDGKQRDVIVHFPQELGGCPIVAKVTSATEWDLTKMIKKMVVSENLHGHHINMFREKNQNRANEQDPKYAKDIYLMKVTDSSGKPLEVKNRFKVAEEEENNELNADFLSWKDVAGHEHNGALLERPEETSSTR